MRTTPTPSRSQSNGHQAVQPLETIPFRPLEGPTAGAALDIDMGDTFILDDLQDSPASKIDKSS